MDIKTMISEKLIVLNKEQKKAFFAYLPSKVYKTERNIGILVAFTQILMISLFLFNHRLIFFQFNRSMQYFSLYTFLLVSTIVALFSYRYTKRNNKDKAFLWVRRIYAIILFIWVIGITLLEQSSGRGITVFCYLMPTMAALLLLTPYESTFMIVGVWLILIFMLILQKNDNSIFGDVINTTFVMILTLFISYRYYHSMAVEFCDRETITSQYDRIEKSNVLLQRLAQVDQLTGLYNRHYLMGRLYTDFESYKSKKFHGLFLMMDIDYFKQFNDNYGHLQGDECLRILAKILENICEENDANAIRFGGEEFLIVKACNQFIDGKEFAYHIQDEIRRANIKRFDTEVKYVSVSMGVWYGELSDIPHIEAVIKEADDALYRAKESGRNCIVEVPHKSRK